MQWLIKWGVRKWLIGIVNTALKEYADKVVKARLYVAVAIQKIEAVTAYLKALEKKLDDGTITDSEVDEAIAEAKALAAKLVEKSDG